MIPCFCVDDKNQPAIFTDSMKVKEGEKYHITHIYKMINMGNMFGCDIYEKPIAENYEPYEHWLLSRFGIEEKHIADFIELIKNCGELNDFDMTEIKELIKEGELILE